MNINLETVEIPVSFENFTRRFEDRLGRYDDVSLKSSRTLEELEFNVNAMRGKEPFSIYAIHDHGRLAELAGTPRKAKQYVIGNSRLATRMTIHEIQVALYAPINFLIYEDYNGKVKLEYLTITSLLAQFSNSEVQSIARLVDEKRSTLIKSIVEDVQDMQST